MKAFQILSHGDCYGVMHPPPRWPRRSRLTADALLMALLASGAAAVMAQEEDEPPPPPASLKTVPIPGPAAAMLNHYVADKAAAIRLGKALFWDTRVGSDNKTACATCHFHAGADNRIKNQLNPGILAGDRTFQLGGPNYAFKASDFPFTVHADVNSAQSQVSDKNDIASSQGVYTRSFTDVAWRTGSADNCEDVSDAVNHGGSGFNLNGVNTRRVEPRNTPTIFNTIFNFRNFWDGRASSVANGGDPFGLRNPDMHHWRVENGVLRPFSLAIATASLASLGSGPPVSENEMSCKGRTLAKLGTKLVKLVPLADQKIAPTDSTLAPLINSNLTYADLIRQAFQPDYWNSRTMVNVPGANSANFGNMDLPRSRNSQANRQRSNPGQISQMEANFSLFFGLAIQLYSSTLVSDDTPFDRFAAGNTNALTAQQQRGMAIFRSPNAQCIHCHSGPEFTSASFSNVTGEGRLDQRAGANNSVFRYDNGFFNTGVRPTTDDLGVGGLDPFNNPLSESRLSQLGKTALLGEDFDAAREVPVAAKAPLAVDGAFKTPGLRNVEFTGPYFHNGGKATLMQVVDFYNRGGDFTTQNQPVPDPTIKPLGLSETQKKDLVAFLLALSDDRVRFKKAPFDHPSICVPHGHEGDENRLRVNRSGDAIDTMMCLPEVGAGGVRTGLKPFLDLDPYQH
ncbi:cytochrome-c peroxidase [Polaromonas hydrogenivorans]|uniref:Cytochrome c peroxidase n=1 Tax=Polaromonas hydrogenivorans TaxID=335476 RepID=A0AAU7LM46_9BURK